MKARVFGYFLFLSLFAAKVCADVPEDLMFHNKPIDALCFFNLEGKVINLKKCGLAEEKYVFKGQNSKLIEKGFIGYDWQNPEFQGSAEGYSYYKFFNAGKNLYWLYTVNSGGGSGEFTAINLVKRKTTNTLEMTTLSSGDRCNGGSQDVSEKNNHLTFSVNLTAYDFIALSKKSSPTIKAYDDLAACAVCCVAKAFYEVNSNAQIQLKYIDLGSIKTEEMSQQGTRQSCFNKLFASYITLSKTKLKKNILDEFAIKFDQMCMKI